MKKTLKFSDIYIAYLPLVVFLLNLLYGLLNIEGVGDSDSRYSLLFVFLAFEAAHEKTDYFLPL